MEFSPNNNIVKLCAQAMAMEENGKPEEAGKLLLQARDQATNDFEQYLAAYCWARHQKDIPEKLAWFEKALQLALKINSDSVKSAFPLLYSSIARCYEGLHDLENATKNYQLAASFKNKPEDKGPFFHGTRVDLQIGDLLTAGNRSNYNAEVIMNHIYFTATINGAGLAASLAKGDGAERVYIVEPMGAFENDPNLTDKKFPGNPTRSYRTQTPLKITGEVTDFARLTPGELQTWREKLANVKGSIIN